MDEEDVWNGLSDDDFLSVTYTRDGDDSLPVLGVVDDDSIEKTVTICVVETLPVDAGHTCIGADGLSTKNCITEESSFEGSRSSSTEPLLVKIDQKTHSRKPIPLLKFRYGRLWVSDLTTQLWCEQQMVFNFEPPPELRLEELVEAPEIAIGSSLHLVRELEVEDKVQVKVTSKEDRFAIKVVNLLEATLCLLTGVTDIRREIPVFGAPFGGNVFIVGVMDEVRCDSDKMEFEIVEFKTRATNAMPVEVQAKTHKLQVMLYKKLLDDLISHKLSKYEIARHLGLQLYRPFGKSVTEHTKNFKASTLDKLLDVMFEKLQSVPFASSLLVEYAYQRDGSTIGISQVDYNESWLEEQVNWCLSYWNGRREEPVGVDIEDAWKCNRCAYSEYCPSYDKNKEKLKSQLVESGDSL